MGCLKRAPFFISGNHYDCFHFSTRIIDHMQCIDIVLIIVDCFRIFRDGSKFHSKMNLGNSKYIHIFIVIRYNTNEGRILTGST